MRRAAIAICLLLPLAAQAAQNPELAARVGDNDDGSETSKALAISKLTLDVELRGDTARTTLTASFENSGKEVLEGNFVFDLPPGSVVTGYRLDIDGSMVDGVLAARRQAKLVYEQAVRRGIDPGLAEVTRDGAFMTRIFPILPHKGRTVRLEFVTLLEPDRPFAIPLMTEKAAGTVAIRVHAAGAAPALTAPDGMALAWTKDKDGATAEGTLAGRALSGALAIAPETPKPLRLTRHDSGEVFFEINDSVAASASMRRQPARLRVFWDSSRSRRDQDLDAEIALLGRYVDAIKPKSVELVFFSDMLPVTRALDNPGAADISGALKDVEYRGATSIETLLKAGFADTEMCLMFTDGNITIDSWRAERLRCPLFTVSGARGADRGFLAALARRNGGEFVDLTALTPQSALARLTREAPRVLDVTDGEGRTLDYALLSANGNRLRIVGRAPRTGPITVTLARAGVAARSYRIDRTGVEAGNALAALWAVRRIDDMNATDRPDRDRMFALAKRYSVAGAAADFVVYENAYDYVHAGVAPPPSASADLLKEYDEAVREERKRKDDAEKERLDKIVALWNEEKTWWNTTFKYRPSDKDKTNRPRDTQANAPPPALDLMSLPQSFAPRERGSGSVETVVVTGSVRPADGPQISMEIAPWNPDRPYLKALDAAAADRFWEVYRAQEKAHGALPAFYFDVGEYLFRHGRAADAIKVVLNTADLPSTDTATLSILADRLMRYGDETRALWLYERIAFLEPDRPQPTRNLAIALIERAERRAGRGGPAGGQSDDYSRALELLAGMVMHDWEERYDGIEIIGLMEANHIIPRLKRLGAADIPLDPRLVDALDVDLRVVLEWNTDGTDMDLWVDEPTGERAIYSNQKTAIGGRLSNDMTGGYGPEEYLLHKAPDGTYTVRVNVYASDRINPNGATNIRAHVFRNYGRANEEEQTLELELKRATEGAQLIGTLKVGK